MYYYYFLDAVQVIVAITVIYLLIANVKLRGRISSLEVSLKQLVATRLAPEATQEQPVLKTSKASIEGAADPITTRTVAPDDQAAAPGIELQDQEVAPQGVRDETPKEAGPWERSGPQTPVSQEQIAAQIAQIQSESTGRPSNGRASNSRPPKAVAFEPLDLSVPQPSKMDILTAWLVQNWFYVVSAISLAMAGVYLVIYGMEQGLLPPIVRVIATFIFGGALIAGGEFIRRRYGDDEDSNTAYLPSTFSGAGIVVLFAAVLSARFLYGFIGPEVALLGLALVGAIAMVFGWFYGPFLAAVGIIGAMVAPFIIGGSSKAPEFLFLYFALITLVGLGIDTLRRWAWVSILSLVLGLGAGSLLMASSYGSTAPFFIVYCAVLAIAAIVIPERKWTPDHAGITLSDAFTAKNKDQIWPDFPTWLAGGTLIAASGLIGLTALDAQNTSAFWTAIVVLSGLILALMLWARKATALTDLAAFPSLFFLGVVASRAHVWQAPVDNGLDIKEALPLDASFILGLGLVISVVAAWRSLRGGRAQLFFAAGAALFAPMVAIVLEVFWQPAGILGTYGWALHALAVGAVMVGMAERFARVDGPQNRERIAFAVLSALASITFAIVLILSSAALTSAIAITIVAAAWLDRKYNLPLMGLYILAGVIAVGYRLVADPGLAWAYSAPFLQMVLSHGGAVLAFAVAWYFAKSARRERSAMLLESAVFSSGGILVSLFLLRAVTYWGGGSLEASHWLVGIFATIWMALGFAQARRIDMGGSLTIVRQFLSVGFLLYGGLQLFGAVVILNPVFDWRDFSPVIGPIIFNTLALAYLLPAAVIALALRWLPSLTDDQRRAGWIVVTLLSVLWLTLSIRHFWVGPLKMTSSTMGQPELYSYTVELLVIGAACIYQSLARRSSFLRKAGLIVIGLAVAKVFLWDIQGLGGLIRVFSLMFLGLALAGLAWLNRWAAEQGEPRPDQEPRED